MQPLPSCIALNAHAKINWALAITGTRSDGYHEVDMLMQSISLCDHVVLCQDSQLTLDAPGTPAGSGNIAYRAAELLAQQAGIPCQAQITITKNIPSQAGLGGGSADAAAVLLGLNQLWGLHWPLHRLMPIALALGADVPFQLQGGLCRAQGIGEKLTELPVPDYWLVLAMPDQGASTQQVYQMYDRIGSKNQPDISKLVQTIRDQQSFLPLLANALEDAAMQLVPQIDALRTQLEQLGAIASRMTGSGSCVFGVFPNQQQAQQACDQLYAPFKTVCHTVRQSPRITNDNSCSLDK